LKFFLGDVFDDVIILTGQWMYILSFDLRLKNRINLVANESEQYAIKDLNDLVVSEYS
jgi:hypothetical protein